MIHGAREMSSRPEASIKPHSGSGGCAPSPRKLRPAAASTAVETPSVATTISGGTTLGQQVAEDHAQVARGDGRTGFEVRFALLDQDHAVSDAGVERDSRDAHGDHRIGETCAQNREAGERDDDLGEREQHIDAAHQDALGPAAGIAAYQTHQQADRQRDTHRDEADAKRQLCAENHPAEQVPAEFVGAEPVRRVRRSQAAAGAHLQRVEGGEPGREQRRKHERGDDHETDHAAGAAQQRGQETACSPGRRLCGSVASNLRGEGHLSCSALSGRARHRAGR